MRDFKKKIQTRDENLSAFAFSVCNFYWNITISSELRNKPPKYNLKFSKDWRECQGTLFKNFGVLGGFGVWIHHCSILHIIFSHSEHFKWNCRIVDAPIQKTDQHIREDKELASVEKNFQPRHKNRSPY